MSSRRAFRLVPLQEPEPAAELAVVVGCHGFVCTFPVRHVDRLLRRDEVEVMPPRGRRGRDAGVPLPQVVLAAGEPFVAWNLGTMLDMPPVTAAIARTIDMLMLASWVQPSTWKVRNS